MNSYPSHTSTGTAPVSHNPNSYYENKYSYSLPNSYPPEPSTPMITVNAGGPFYRESQHTDSGQEKPTTDKPQKEASTSSKSEDNSGNKKRQADLAQLSKETQEQKNEQDTLNAIQI